MVGSSPEVVTALSAQEEVNSARTKEWRSKLNHDRASKAASLATSIPGVAASAGAEYPAPSAAQVLGDFLSVPAVPGLDAPVARGLRSKAALVEIILKSARSAGDSDESILNRAVRLTADKNSSATKTTPPTKKQHKGTQLDPIFGILQNIPDAHLLSVASDSCVVFPAAPSAASETLSLIRANELAQAALASTRIRLEIEKEQAAAKSAEEKAAKELAMKEPVVPCPEGGSR